MAPLKNLKQEKFVNYIFKGCNQREAYTKAGYSIKSTLAVLDSNASRLANTEKVLARLAELQQKAEDASIMSVMERKQRLTEIARGDLTDFIDEDGEVKPFNNTVPNHRAVLEYSTATTFTKKGDKFISKSVKLLNPITAIDVLNKMEKVYDDAPKVQILNQTFIQNNLSTLSDEELNDLERIIGKATPLIGTNTAGESAP
jgi:phage terminase small subunit